MAVQSFAGTKYFRESRSEKIGNFTLIELLVVISIIAILAGLILPALNSSREKAKQMKCASQFKSFGQANALYASSFDDWTVPNNIGTGWEYRWTANTAYLEFLQMKVLDWEWGRGIWHASRVCPNAIVPETGYSEQWRSSGHAYGKTYYGGDAGDGKSSVNYTENQNKIFRMTKVVNPSGKFFIMEAYSDGPANYWGRDPLDKWWKLENNGGSESYIAYRHGKGQTLNIVFFDGHVENLRYTSLIPDNTISRTRWSPYERMARNSGY